MLEYVESDLYFVQNKIDFIYVLLVVTAGAGTGSGSVEKSTGSGSDGQKINGSDQIRILIPTFKFFIYISY